MILARYGLKNPSEPARASLHNSFVYFWQFPALNQRASPSGQRYTKRVYFFGISWKRQLNKPSESLIQTGIVSEWPYLGTRKFM